MRSLMVNDLCSDVKSFRFEFCTNYVQDELSMEKWYRKVRND